MTLVIGNIVPNAQRMKYQRPDTYQQHGEANIGKFGKAFYIHRDPAPFAILITLLQLKFYTSRRLNGH
jgi:hypothetical protein